MRFLHYLLAAALLAAVAARGEPLPAPRRDAPAPSAASPRDPAVPLTPNGR